MAEARPADGVERLARAYFKLLSRIDWKDDVLVAGLREGLNKFLSNAHLAAFPGQNKYHKTHFISHAALLRIESGSDGDLVWEHLVPKQVYIQAPCQQQARDGTLTLEFVEDRLRKFWRLATVTAEEDRLLPRRQMPTGWNGEDILARYAGTPITLVPNPYFERLTRGGRE